MIGLPKDAAKCIVVMTMAAMKSGALGMGLALLAGLASFAAGWQWRTASAQAVAAGAGSNGKSALRSLSELEGHGDELLSGWAAKVETAHAAELEDLASLLAKEARGRDLALWIPLLARWSESDGAAMIAFIESKAPASLKDQLLGQAWFAWGASDPDAAFAAARQTLKPELARMLLSGIAETDAHKAVEYLWQLPDAQFSVSAVTPQVIAKAPELTEELLARAVYDGGRMPLQRAWISELAEKDPDQALSFAQGIGSITQDSVAQAIGEIAQHHPEKAAEQLAAMPSNRTKALGAVALAGAWAAQDADKAIAWIRGNTAGPTRHYALVSAASASEKEDPERALDLLQEAGVDPGGNFFHPYQYGITPMESFGSPNVHVATVDLLRRLSLSDPEKARRLAAEKLGDGVWKQWAVEAGVKP